MDRLDAMRTFVAVVDGQGFSAAARKLGMPLPTVSRRVGELEEHIGTQLLVRTTRRVTVTDSGQQFYHDARRILDNVAEAEALARREYRSIRGLLTVAAPELFGRLHVLPILRAFMAGQPEVTARLLMSNAVADLSENHVDLGIRIGRLEPPDLVAVPLGTVRHLFCASPAFLAAKGRPRHPDDLAGLDCVTFSKSGEPLPWPFRIDGVPRGLAIAARLSVNTAEAAADAAMAGDGVTWLYAYQAAPHIAAGLLEPVLAAFEPEPVPVSIIYPMGRVLPQKTRHFIDFAAERLKSALVAIELQCRHSTDCTSGGSGTK